MTQPLSDDALDTLFREARTHTKWLDQDVSDAQIEAIWELLKMAPTSANQLPARLIWCKSDEAKQRLAGHAMEGNRNQITKAPVCVIVAMDIDFHEHLPDLYPPTDAKSWFDGDEEGRKVSAFRNSSLQGAYLILAARAMGLDCGPMSGFDNDAVDADFFADEPQWKSNFICAIGHGDHDRVYPRSPRPAFDRFNRLI